VGSICGDSYLPLRSSDIGQWLFSLSIFKFKLQAEASDHYCICTMYYDRVFRWCVTEASELNVGPMIIGFRVWYRNRPSPESCPDSPPWGLARSCPDPVSHSRILAESCPDSDSNLKNCRKNRKNPPKIYYKYALSSSMSMTFAFALPPRWMVFRMVTILTNSLCSECNCLYVQ
jgi:hypothetical protein